MAESYLSLGPVLDLIERWQFGLDPKDDLLLSELDMPSLRTAVEQYAAQLRLMANTERFCNQLVRAEYLDGIADFLAPRREPEAE